MATLKEQTCKGSIRVATGVDGEGKTTFGTRTIQYINPEISDTNLNDILAGWANFSNDTLSSYIRTDQKTFEP